MSFTAEFYGSLLWGSRQLFLSNHKLNRTMLRREFLEHDNMSKMQAETRSTWGDLFKQTGTPTRQAASSHRLQGSGWAGVWRSEPPWAGRVGRKTNKHLVTTTGIYCNESKQSQKKKSANGWKRKPNL